MAKINLQQLFDSAAAHHLAGRLQEAELLYQQILALQPDHAQALHQLGVLNHQAGRNGIAMELLHRAIAVRPDFAEAHSNLGNIEAAAGHFDSAIADCRQAIALCPNFAGAHINLGVALMGKKQPEQAVVAFRQGAALDPSSPLAHANLGKALNDLGRWSEAIVALGQWAALAPGDADARNCLGMALRSDGQSHQAAAAFRQAIALRSDFADAHANLGVALKDVGQFDQAIASLRQALAANPRHAAALYNLSVVLHQQGRLDEAIESCRRAMALKPGWAEAHSHLGGVLKDAGRLEEAIAALRQAIALATEFHEAHENLVYLLHFHVGSDAQAIAVEQRQWNDRYALPLTKLAQASRAAAGAVNSDAFEDRRPDRPLRIGYVSPDFRNHVVGRNLLPLFRLHDHRQFKIFCYANSPRPDDFTVEFQRHADGWRDIVRLSDEQVAKVIADDRIDVLVDLSLHMAGNRLLAFARRPAPVQATFAGYPGSTGLTAIDFRLSDPWLDPPGMDESIYSEQTIRLPDSFWCFDPLETRDIAVNSLPALSLSNGPAPTNGFIAFGCLNNFGKINQHILAIWARVLRQVRSSRLLLLAPVGSHRQRTLDDLRSLGVESDRVEFVLLRPRREYLSYYHRIDLGLDSFPYNGHSTSLDSFWMGVPVVTLVGQTAVSRAGWCQSSNLGLPELAAQTPDQFVKIAVELANDLPRLQELRSTLRARLEQSPLMDAPGFTRHVESAYRQMWRRYCQGR